MRRGTTLPELLLVCALLGLVAGFALPRVADALDGVRVTQAAHEVAGALTLARAAAIRRAAFAAVILDEREGTVRVESLGDTLLHRALRADHRVTLRATRDTLTYGPDGLGHGAANSTIVIERRAHAETVTVSRLGRTRRSW